MPGRTPSRDDRRLQGLSVFLILFGLLLGPGYYAYSRYVSGEDSATLELTERSDRFTLDDGSIQRFRSGFGYRPTPLAISPERNEIRLTLRFHFPDGAAPADATNRYLVTALDGDYPISQHEVTVGARAGTSRTVRLPPFATRSPLDHSLVVEELGKAAFPADRLSVTVRERVFPLSPTYTWSGFAVLLVGAVLYVVGLRRM